MRFDRKDKEVLFWTLPENMTQKEYKLQLIGNTRSYEVIVRYDSNRDCWFIQYKEMKKSVKKLFLMLSMYALLNAWRVPKGKQLPIRENKRKLPMLRSY